MARIRFEQLLELYRDTQFAGEGSVDDESELTIASLAIVDLLVRLETDEEAAADAGIALLDDIDQVAVGATVKVRIDAPRLGLGVLARNVDGLLNSIGARVEEPRRFYLIDPGYASDDAAVPDVIGRYRKVLEIVNLLACAASFLDTTRSEIIFVKEGKVVLPVRFDAADLAMLDIAAADRLLGQFADDLHHDQKCSILFEAMIDLCRAHKLDGRFKFVLANLCDLADKLAAGYKLFASSFSYSKIKGELEDARIDYTQKIHKTIVDIQSQLLGIPVATVVVASQMKVPTACGPELWVNFAVLISAWIFVGLLLIAIVNQWLTLSVIHDEIERQKKSLEKDYPTVGGDFVGTFNKLNARICWHKAGLSVIAAVGLMGAVVATCFYGEIAKMTPQPCAIASKANLNATLNATSATAKGVPALRKSAASASDSSNATGA
jgi:hypothetical protein